MILAYTAKLGLKVQVTNIGVEKIDSSTLKTFGMILASSQANDKLDKSQFF